MNITPQQTDIRAFIRFCQFSTLCKGLMRENRHSATQGAVPAVTTYATALKNFISIFRDVFAGSALNFLIDMITPGSKLATN